MNYVETISQLEKNLQEIGEDPENLTYVFRELKSWSLLDFIFHQFLQKLFSEVLMKINV